MNVLKKLFQKNKQPSNSLEERPALKISFFLLFPLLILFIVEFINKRWFLATLIWPFFSPVEFIVNYILVLCFFVFFSAIFGKTNVSAPVTFAFLVILSLISSYKESILGEPLFPWDIYMVKLVLNLLPYVYKSLNLINIAFFLLSIGVIFALSIYVKKYILPIWMRLIASILCSALIVTFAASPYIANILFPKIGVKNMDWVQMDNYDKNGFTLAFIMNIKNILIKKPEKYTKNNIIKSVQAVNLTNPINDIDTSPNKDKSIKPNVIVIMSEAFWDPTLLENVSFSTDPLPTFRKLRSEFSSGYLLSPTFGGGTSNVEFEFLTGNSMNFLPDGCNPYQQYINKPIPSLASIFSGNGYASVAIHSYHKWFFNRDKVYPLIGFNKFISAEDFIKPQSRGFYISDQEIPKMIISEHKKAKKPVFIFTITMQNHGPYDIKRYAQPFNVKVSGRNVSEQNLSILQDYTQGVYDADKSLKTVINYFSTVKEPTVVVFFGDHLPLLGNDFSVYKECGYISPDKIQWTKQEYKKMYSTPLVIWTNYPHEKKDIQTLDASFLGEYLLDFINIPEPLYFKFLKDMRKELPGNMKYLKIASDNSLYNNSDLPPELNSLESTYWLFQYDLLFGKGYAEKLLF